MANQGIYLYTNLVNGKQYVGQTKDFKRRFNEHKNSHKQVIDRAIDKYGLKSFEIRILQDLSHLKGMFLDNYLDILEKYFIDLLKPEYNFTEGGKRWNHSEIEKNKISQGVRKHYANNPNINEHLSKSHIKRWENNPQLKKEYSERMKSDKNPMNNETAKLHHSKLYSNTGIYHLGKLPNKQCVQGFTWAYSIERYVSKNGKKTTKRITSVSLPKLLKKLENEGIELIILDEDKAKKTFIEGGVDGGR